MDYIYPDKPFQNTINVLANSVYARYRAGEKSESFFRPSEIPTGWKNGVIKPAFLLFVLHTEKIVFLYLFVWVRCVVANGCFTFLSELYPDEVFSNLIEILNL
ncbi:hypothetical protein AVEN_171617-1 [Araneus ventricosus]|uniref:Uncharacterized protein n=1 Tax=Araneus ventricosus TaxID=182803 RepID=A0A4Y2SC78_ARAVE|nr:hypothetical protein AVEN_171617-1 [Araneus ventricosus]